MAKELKQIEQAEQPQVIEQATEKKTDKEFVAQVIIVIVLALLLFYTYGRVNSGTTGSVISEGSVLPSVSASEVIPTGTPKVYGSELGIKYDDISPSDQRKADATIAILTKYDNTITLTGENLQRYVKLGSMIACEYCCGATTLVFSDGQPACGCAHSYAMRGLAKYLIKNHGTEFSDDEILEEMGKWKVLFFPGIHQQKAAVLKSQGIELNYINLASNKYRGAEKGQANSGGAMVGGC